MYEFAGDLTSPRRTKMRLQYSIKLQQEEALVHLRSFHGSVQYRRRRVRSNHRRYSPSLSRQEWAVWEFSVRIYGNAAHPQGTSS